MGDLALETWARGGRATCCWASLSSKEGKGLGDRHGQAPCGELGMHTRFGQCRLAGEGEGEEFEKREQWREDRDMGETEDRSRKTFFTFCLCLFLSHLLGSSPPPPLSSDPPSPSLPLSLTSLFNFLVCLASCLQAIWRKKEAGQTPLGCL